MADWSEVGRSALARATGAIEKAYLYVNIKSQVDKHKYVVKYNPSTLHISARAGDFRSSGVGAGGMNQITQLKGDDQITLDVDIILEDLNNLDAFMSDKTMMNAGVAQTATSAVMSFVKGDYSVQDQAEAFVGLLMTEEYRKIQFCWARMAFTGEVTSVQTQYTMFSPKGHPIRAVVHLTIQQNAGKNMDETYWENALNELFPEGDQWLNNYAGNSARAGANVDQAIDSRNWQSFVGNLINI